MKKVAIFLSDFHLGQRDKMEEFYADKEFAELIQRFSLEHPDDEVDLVLLGDIVDLETTLICIKELTAQTAEEIESVLHLPVESANEAHEGKRAQESPKESVLEKELGEKKVDPGTLFPEKQPPSSTHSPYMEVGSKIEQENFVRKERRTYSHSALKERVVETYTTVELHRECNDLSATSLINERNASSDKFGNLLAETLTNEAQENEHVRKNLESTTPDLQLSRSNKSLAPDINLEDSYEELPEEEKQNPYDRALSIETKKLHSIIKEHQPFFEALGKFLAPHDKKRSLIYVPGNHDHSLVHPELQDVIREAILPEGPSPNKAILEQRKSKIQFPSHYYDETLQVYAEHGNQLAYGGTFRYEDFEKFGGQCPGHFELKFIWNRLERRSSDFDNVFMGALSPGKWSGIFWWLLLSGSLRHLTAFRRYHLQYKNLLKKTTNQNLRDMHERMPHPWQSAWHFFKGKYFKWSRDEFSDQILQLFQQYGKGLRPMCPKGWLNPQKIKTVVLGHSHHPKEKKVPGFDGVKYFNTGSWIFRHEKGRRTVEQTWLKISRPNGEYKPRNGDHGLEEKIIDRELEIRSVEIPRKTSSPVTEDGRDISPELRKLKDLRVGDVVLIHWNYLPTVKRLFKSFHWIKLVQEIPHMIINWLNRYGTRSYWSHAAMVYGSPFEKEESDQFNNPLLLEALPGSGVGIHKPKQFMTHPKEWNIAILRVEKDKAPWLEKWENRARLRRLALSNLDSDYARSLIFEKIFSYASQMLDQGYGRPRVAGLFIGAFLSVILSSIALVIWSLSKIGEHLWDLWKINASIHALWSNARGWLSEMFSQISQAIPCVEDPTLGFVTCDLVFLLNLIVFFVILPVIAALAFKDLLLKVALLSWVRLTAAVGALYGLLVVTVMTELSGGWEEKKRPTEKWAATLLWSAIPVLTLLFGKFILDLDLKQLSALLLFSALLLVFLPGPLSTLASWIVKPVDIVWGRFKPKTPPETQKFMCSGLVQYALYQAAQEVNREAKESDGLKEEDRLHNVIAYPSDEEAKKKFLEEFKNASEPQRQQKLKEILHQNFADSENFKWIHLLFDGQLITNPTPVQKTMAEPYRLKKQDRQLSWKAMWSLRLALLGLVGRASYETWSYEWFPLQNIMKTWPAIPDFTQINSLPWLLMICGGLGFTALFLSISAKRDLIVNSNLIGKRLSTWGLVLGIIGLVITGNWAFDQQPNPERSTAKASAWTAVSQNTPLSEFLALPIQATKE